MQTLIANPDTGLIWLLFIINVRRVSVTHSLRVSVFKGANF